MAPDEIMRVVDALAGRRAIDKTVDCQFVAQAGQNVSAVGRDAGLDRGQGREPRHAHGQRMIAGSRVDLVIWSFGHLVIDWVIDLIGH
jgi:hypothetical protein